MKKFLFFVLFCAVSTFCKKTVYIVNRDIDLRRANSSKSYSVVRDGIEKMGYDIFWTHQIDQLNQFDILLFHNFSDNINKLKKYPKEKLVLFMWEPPTVLPNMYKQEVFDCFGKIYTWDDSLVDNKKFFKFHYPQYRKRVEYSVPFDQKKLAVTVNCNKNSLHPYSLYGERRNVIRFFEDNYPEDFDLYGRGWRAAEFPSYRGFIGSKLDCIKDYKFCFAYENMQNVKGYVTEKIFDAFMAGCVPVYWGAENIVEYIPKNCFVDRRDFESNEHLYWFLKNMTQQEYEEYLENIRNFIDSDQFILFSKEYYLYTLLQAIKPDYDKSILKQEYFDVVQRVEFFLKEKVCAAQ